MAEFTWTDSSNNGTGEWSGAFSDSSHWAQVAPPLPPGSEHPAGPPGASDIANIGAPIAIEVSGNGTAGFINAGGQITFTGSITTQGLSGQTGFLVSGGTTTFGAGSSLTVQNKDMVVGFANAASFRAQAGGDVNISVGGGLGALYVGGNSGSAGSSAEFTGSGTTLTTNSGLVVGLDVQATLSFRNGAVATMSHASFGNYIGFNSGSNGLLEIESGASVTGTGFAVIGGNAGSHGRVHVTGAGSSWNQDISISVGFSGEGTLEIEDEAAVTTDGLGVGNEAGAIGDVGIRGGSTLENGIARLGIAQGSSGKVHVTGENSAWTSSGAVNVGEAGLGEVKIGTGGAAEMAGLLIARDATSGSLATPSVVEVEDGDSSLTVNGDAYVGQSGQGKLAVAGGTITISGELVAGNLGGGAGLVDAAGGGGITISGASVIAGNQGNGTIGAVAGGNISANNAALVAGNQAGSSGKVESAGAGSSIQSLSLIVGGSGVGLLEVKDGGAVTTLSGATIGLDANATQSVARVESGGLWALNGNLVVADGGNALLELASGGTIGALGNVSIATDSGSIGVVELNPLLASLTPTSLGWGGVLTVGLEGSAMLSIHNGALVAPTLSGAGVVEVAALSGSHGEIEVNGADSRFEAIELFLGGSFVNEGGIAELLVANSGYASIQDKIIFHTGATISVASGGTIEIGTPGGAALGSITLHADGELSGNGLIDGPLVNDGTVAASTNTVAGVTDHRLEIHGNVTGAGLFTFDGPGEIEFEGDVAATLTVTFDIPGVADERIIIANPGASGFLATIDSFALGDVIELSETEGHLAHFDDLTNVLEILDAADTVVATLQLTDANDGQSFIAYSNGGIGTIVRLDGGGNADPAITSGATFDVAEDSQLVGFVTADDPDPDPDELRYFIAGGLDAALFAIDETTGVLSFIEAPNFENPLDDDLDNAYEVKVRAFDDLGAFDEQDIVVTVLDGNDVPEDLELSPQSVLENRPAGTLVGTLSALDYNPGSSFTYTLLDDNGGRFALAGNTIVTTQQLDFEAAAFYDILVEVEDELGGTRSEAFRIDIGNISPETLNGTAAANVLIGGSDIDIIRGLGGNDTLGGNAGNDVIIGGTGRDTMTGGTGLDDFDFNALSEMGKTSSTRDRILDFVHNQDDIDLRTIDAKTGIVGNQAFKFIGTQAFHDIKGELRYFKQNLTGTAKDKTIVEGDVNGDGKADFQIELKGLIGLTKGDFLL